MTGYCIFHRPGDPPEGVVFVREGFSAYAALFNALWALWHRMWVLAAVLFAVFAGSQILAATSNLDANVAAVIQAAAALLLGIEGHRLREWSLRRAGYAEVGFVRAGSREEAEVKYFFSERQPERPVAGAAYRQLAPSQSDPLGLFGNV